MAQGQCPVNHGATSGKKETESNEELKCPVSPSAYHHFLPGKQQEEPKKCPLQHDALATASHEQGCTSDAIDASNNMPAVAQQTPVPGQKMPLSTEREVSSIPRADGQEKHWIYPSEQMFFNAMRRKNWNPDEKDMSVVVPIHNAVNEQAWSKILEWEKLHQTECNQPKLLKFQGRPKDITPKARIRSWFGYTLPFDRHDWTVDRCGEKVTYVIDFYAGKRDPSRPEAVSFYLDVRPALSLQGLWDRLRMSWRKGELL